MTDIMALPPGMVVDNFFDMSPAGIALPVWLVIIIILAIAMIGSNFWWVYKWLVMRPLQGHGIAARSGNEKTQQVLLFGMNRAFSIQALEYVEKVLSFKDKSRVAKWLQTSPYAVGMLGHKSIMLVMEIFDHPKDPIAEMAICKMCEDYNTDNRNPDEAIINYRDYVAKRQTLEHRNPNGVEIPVYGLYDPALIYKFTPENRTSGQFGGTCEKDARDLNPPTPETFDWGKAMPMFIVLAFCIIAIALVYMYTSSGGPAPTLPSSSALTGLIPSGGVK